MTHEPDIIEQPTDLVPINEQAGRDITLSPKEVLSAAKEQADALMEMVTQKHLSTRMGKSEHLHAEAWITIAAFNNIVAKTKWVHPEHDQDGAITGYEAEVELLHYPTGEIRGGAIMSCGLDAFPCQSKRGTEKDKAAKSAAQTWAAAKAIRMTLSYVPVLAGYSPVPYEEMRDSGGSDERDESAPFCEKHGESFRKFEKDGSSWYSHRDGDGWCAYQKPAQQAAPPKINPWGKEPMAAFAVKLKEARGDTAQSDLATIVGEDTSGKALKAFAAEQDLNSPDELFTYCIEQWELRGEQQDDEELPWDEPQDADDNADPEQAE
jgi:hypothetical protein